MSRRIEIELTSARDDATFTWRAAGALQPKGDVAAATLPDGASVGDTFRVEIETGLDGHEITAVVPERAPRHEPERIELIGRDIPDDALVTQQLASRPKGRRGPRRDDRRDGRSGNGRGNGGRDRRASADRRSTDGGDRSRGTQGRGSKSRDGGSERPRPAKKRAPRAPRLRAGHAHRTAYLDTLADEQRPVAEKLIHGGMPNLRQAIESDNAKRREQGQPEVPADGLIRMAESILPGLQVAEWHDRADAALAGIAEIDLRDLRSVVVAADDHAKSPETRALADELRTKVSERVEQAQAAWLADLESAVREKRVARFLNLSSRPPKAGSPLPAALLDDMVRETNEALSAESASGRWVALLDALAYSPIRQRVVPVGVPAEPSDELKAKVAKLAPRLPAIASAFGGTKTPAPPAPPAPAAPQAPAAPPSA